MRKDVAGKEVSALSERGYVEAQMGKKRDSGKGSEGEKQRLHNASSFHKCWVLMLS